MALGCRLRPTEEAVAPKAWADWRSFLLVPLVLGLGFDVLGQEGRPHLPLLLAAATASEEVARGIKRLPTLLDGALPVFF